MRPPAGARRLLLWAAAALPAAGAALFLVLRSGQIPNLDYWWLFPRFFGPNGFAADPGAWFSRSNEHLLTGSYLLYAVNILATRGSNVGLGLLAWLAALAQYALLCRHLARTGEDPGFWRAAAVAAFCFTPAAAQVWIVGFSGVHWCWANLLAMVSLLALLRYLERGGAFRLAAHVAAGLAATLTFGSALALWPAALLAVAWHAPRRVAAGYAAGILALAVAYRAGMPAAAGALGDLRAVPVYVGSFLGGVFTFSLELACLIALAGLLLAAHFAWRLRSAPADRAPWLWVLLALFALGNALLAAVARDGGGPGGAVSSRYALVAGLFWLSLLQLGFIAYPPRQEGRRRVLRLAWAAAGLAMILAMARTGALYAPQLLQRASLQPLVELAAKLGIEDDELVRASITVDPAAWRRALPVLRAHRLEPFAPPTLPCGDGELERTSLPAAGPPRRRPPRKDRPARAGRRPRVGVAVGAAGERRNLPDAARPRPPAARLRPGDAAGRRFPDAFPRLRPRSQAGQRLHRRPGGAGPRAPAPARLGFPHPERRSGQGPDLRRAASRRPLVWPGTVDLARRRLSRLPHFGSRSARFGSGAPDSVRERPFRWGSARFGSGAPVSVGERPFRLASARFGWGAPDSVGGRPFQSWSARAGRGASAA